MYKKFRILKPGIFVSPKQRHGAPIKPSQEAPVGAIISIHASTAMIRSWKHFKQIEEIDDDTPVTFQVD